MQNLNPQHTRQLNGTVAAPIDAVWEALTTARGIGSWWATLDAVPAPEAAEADIRPGGRLRVGMRTADYEDLVTLDFVVRDVDVPTRLVLRPAHRPDTEVRLILGQLSADRTGIRAEFLSGSSEPVSYLVAWSETLRALRTAVESAFQKRNR